MTKAWEEIYKHSQLTLLDVKRGKQGMAAGGLWTAHNGKDVYAEWLVLYMLTNWKTYVIKRYLLSHSLGFPLEGNYYLMSHHCKGISLLLNAARATMFVSWCRWLCVQKDMGLLLNKLELLNMDIMRNKSYCQAQAISPGQTVVQNPSLAPSN